MDLYSFTTIRRLQMVLGSKKVFVRYLIYHNYKESKVNEKYFALTPFVILFMTSAYFFIFRPLGLKFHNISD